MASLNEIVYDVLGDVKSSRITDDANITTDKVKYIVHVQRSMWLNRRLTKPGYMSTEDIIQDLGCIPVEMADTAECCDVNSGCSVLRTSKKIPTPVNGNTDTMITRIGPVDKIGSPFQRVSYSEVPYVGNGKFNKKHVFATYMNDRIYLIFGPDNYEARMIEHLNARGVFEDPQEVREFTKCSGDPCYTDDLRYPVPENLIPFIKQQVFQQLVSNEQMPEDQKNDSNDKASTGQNIPETATGQGSIPDEQ